MPRILMALGVVAAFASGLAAQPSGAPDPGFGLAGRVWYDFGLGGTLEDLAAGLVVQDDGRLVAVGWARQTTGTQGLLFRLLPNGDLDPGYGFYWGAVDADDEAFTDVLRVPGSGDLLVAGWDSEAFSDYAVLLRVDASGAISSEGRINVDSLSGFVRVGRQSNGKILLAWSDSGWQSNADFVVCRFLDPLTIDLSFAEQGCRRVAFDLGVGWAGDDQLAALVVLPDDRIFLAGETAGSNRITLAARLLANGDPDPGYGSGGKVWFDLTPSAQERVYDAALLDDGTALLAGWDWAGAGSRPALVRIAPDGGSYTVAHPGDHGIAAGLGGVAVQGDGKIVVAGADNAGEVYFVRLLPDGSPDPSFGTGGESRFPMDPADPTVGAGVLALAFDAGRPVAAGLAAPSGQLDSAVVRVTSDYLFVDGFESGGTRAWSSAVP